jgi:signal peptide peptidase SppA
MNFEESVIFKALATRQVFAIDRARLYSAVVLAAAKQKNVADAYPEDEEWFQKPYDAGNGVRVIPLSGMVSHGEADWMRYFLDMVETDHVETWMRNAVADPKVTAIVLSINSPGGYVTGTPELGATVAWAAKQKPMIAHTSTLACSAAYWIGCGANLFYATASATVGSIGVFTTHMDLTEYWREMGVEVEVFKSGKNKAAGIAGTELTDEQKRMIQEHVEGIGTEFRAHVVANRGELEPWTMDGRATTAREDMAAKGGLVDSIADLQSAIRDAATLGRRGQSPNGM